MAIYLIRTWSKKSTKLKVVSRAREAKDRRIREIAKNSRYIGSSIFVTLMHGSKRLGQIVSICPQNDEKDGKKIESYEILIKPDLFVIFGVAIPKFWYIGDLIRVSAESVIKDYQKGALVIPPWVGIDFFFNEYYDLEHADEHRNFIKTNEYKQDVTDAYNLIYVESQKRSVIPQDAGLDMALREKELQIELAKKKGQQESI